MNIRKTVLLFAASLSLVAAVPARSQNIVVGYVSMEDAFNRADAKKAGEERINTLAANLKSRLELLRDGSKLPTATWTEYRTLLEKEKPADADKARQAAIQNQVRGLEDELKTLQQTPSPTEDQKRRLNELNGNVTANAGNLQDAAGAYDRQLSDIQGSLRGDIVQAIQEAAKVVAKQKNVSVILNKSITIADDALLVVVAGGVDLTDDIVKQVNTPKK